MSSRIDHVKEKIPCHVCKAMRTAVQKKERARELPDNARGTLFAPAAIFAEK
jgi:hypothetical protein